MLGFQALWYRRRFGVRNFCLGMEGSVSFNISAALWQTDGRTDARRHFTSIHGHIWSDPLVFGNILVILGVVNNAADRWRADITILLLLLLMLLSNALFRLRCRRLVGIIHKNIPCIPDSFISSWMLYTYDEVTSHNLWSRLTIRPPFCGYNTV